MDKDSERFFLHLWETHARELLRYAGRKLRNRDLELETVQDTFLLAIVKMDELKAHPNPGGWLMVTLKHMILQAVERELRQARISMATEKMETSLVADVGLIELLPPDLSPQYVQLLTMFYGERYPIKLICEKLGITPTKCKMDLFYARQKVKKALESTGEGGGTGG